jgi:hypothetical protein
LELLRRMGAESMSLARWGGEGAVVRLECRVRVSQAGGFTRHFEATAPSGAEAAKIVLAAVETWKNARRRGHGDRIARSVAAGD